MDLRPRARTRLLRFAIALGCLAAPAAAQAQDWNVDVMAGTAYNVTTPLTIRQDGFPDIHIDARYATKPFGPFAPYYSWRVLWWHNNGGWEIQQVHHRLFLENTTPEVTKFEVHYGYNFFLIGHAWRVHGFVLHVNAGVIVPNPDNVVRGLNVHAHQQGVFDAGYQLSGGGGSVALTRNLTIAKHVYGVLDGSVMFGKCSVRVANGSASVPNVSMHGHVGVGFAF